MQTPDLISRKKPSKGMDYNLLREEGLKAIRELAGEVWTDHNAHDPGITIMEQLCYAITELTYRANFSIEDLLAEGPQEDQGLFTAREILTCNPITELDFRKRIIDIEGVKNFWIEPTTESEVAFSPDPTKGKLDYDQESNNPNRIRLKGLYKALIEFDQPQGDGIEQEAWGDLNDNSVSGILTFSEGPLAEYEIGITANYAQWNTKSIDWERYDEIGKSLISFDLDAKEEHNQFKISISAEESDGDFPFEILVEILDTSTTQGTRKPTLAKEVKAGIEQFIYSHQYADGNSLVGSYQRKIFHIHEILERVRQRLHDNRNLCEDFTVIEPMQVEDILVCAEIEIEQGVNPDQVLAKTYLEIGNFISPKPGFESLESMREAGAYTDEIFEGPELDHGFLRDEVLQKAERREMLHVSDLINLIMDIEGVEAVKNIQLAKLILNEDQEEIPGKEERWCLALEHKKNFIPRLNLERSVVNFRREDLPIVANEVETQRIYKELKSSLEKQPEVGPLDLSIPSGKNQNLEDYYSIQHEFPTTYGIGAEGLADTEPASRKAKARQLSGYLSIMEQVLANAFSQVANVGNLFALHEKKPTYFSQPLYDIPRALELVRPFLKKNGFKTETLNESPDLVNSKWEELKEDPDNYLRDALNEVTKESIGGNQTNVQRKNRFLDHLMARFGEQYYEYSTMLNRTYADASSEELIHDKVSIVKNYSEISHDRGKGFNYKKVNELWDTRNVTGLEKRIMRLLGIEEVERRFLGNYFEVFLDNKDKYRWRIRREEDEEIILNSEQGYETREEIKAVLEQVMELGKLPEFYQPKETVNRKNVQYFFNLINHSGEIIGISRQLFKTEEERDEELEMVIGFLNEKEDEEGLHVVEHILLRPRIAYSDELLPVNLTQEEEDGQVDCPCDSDPYSFRLSVFLPAWPQRFRNMDFRHYIETKIRMETPAHIFPKICWVNKTQMKDFENNYRDWLSANAVFDFEPKEVFGSNDFNVVVQNLRDELGTLKERIRLSTNIPESPDRFRRYFEKLARRVKTIQGDTKEALEEELTGIDVKLEKLETMMDYSEKHRQLLKSITSIRNVYPYATLSDCKDGTSDTLVSLDNTILGSFDTGPDAVRVAYPKRRDITDEGIGNLMIGKDFKIYTMKQREKEGLDRMKIGKNFKVK